MSFIICPCVGDTFVGMRSEWHGPALGGPRTIFSGAGTNNGRQEEYFFGNNTFEQHFGQAIIAENATAILQFNVAELGLFARARRVTLVQGVVDGQQPGVTALRLGAATVQSGSINVESRINWNNQNDILTYHPARQVPRRFEGSVDGILRETLDITDLYNSNLAHVQQNIFTMYIERDNRPMTTNTSPPFLSRRVSRERVHRERFPYLIVDAILRPGPAPVIVSPTTVQNPRHPIVFRWNHVRDPALPQGLNDPQTDSELRFRRGTAAWQTRSGGTGNTVTLPADTFAIGTAAQVQVRTRTHHNAWGAWSAITTIPLALTPPLAPTDLNPTASQNPRGNIRLSWLHVPNPEAPDDVQTDSEFEWGRWSDLHSGSGPISAGLANAGTVMPAHIPPGTATLFFRARTRSQINDWGPWSAIHSFPLAATPPLAPELIFPVNVAINATGGVPLSWSYNSPHDTTPTQFDVRWRHHHGQTSPWYTHTVPGQDGNPAPANLLLNLPSFLTDTQSTVEWQVRAHGAFGDEGPWSPVAAFFTIGPPPPPTIVEVTDSNRPVIRFSATGVMGWELELTQNGRMVYATGSRPFDGAFAHRTQRFLPNGSYLARLRITNEYGLQSGWATLPFTLAAAAPPPIALTAANNLTYHTRLYFAGAGRVVYVYRAEMDAVPHGGTEGTEGAGQNPQGAEGVAPYGCIARVENAAHFDDYTVQPGVRYRYFVRAVDANYAFTDSNTVAAMAEFMETALAPAENPEDMLLLLGQLDGKPTKDSSFTPEQTLTTFAGRVSPVLQAGTHTQKVLNLSFYISMREGARLEALAQSGKVLLLRDWRLGAVYGAITGGIQARADGFSDGSVVSFAFTRTDYRQEVDLA